MLENTLINDDSLNVMRKIGDNEIDVIYLDPPFYTQDIQKLSSRENEEIGRASCRDRVSSPV